MFLLFFLKLLNEQRFKTTFLANMKLSLALIATAAANKAERKALREDRQMRAEKRKLFTPLRYVYQL